MKIIIADNSERDAERLQLVVKKIGLDVEVCKSGPELAACLEGPIKDVAGLLILWELPGPPFGSELLVRARRNFPNVPVVVLSNALDVELAARANELGAYDFLQKPFDLERVRTCVNSLLRTRDPLSSTVITLKERIVGDSLPLLTMLKQVARAIQRDVPRVLLIGESGTGKELVARALHELGTRQAQPFIAVNVASIAKELMESEFFGHEKGAFTGAGESHRGYLEQSGNGILFLDEIGELDLPLQKTLLRAIQEKRFRRVKGTREIDFSARLICATNLDLPAAVKRGDFRADLFHRIAEFMVQIPPLRERPGDVDLLLDHFLPKYAGKRPVRIARETLTILRSYSFHTGNVRELENCVKSALTECEDDLVLPKHLPLSVMAAFIVKHDKGQPKPHSETVEPRTPYVTEMPDVYQELISELVRSLPSDWRDLAYKELLRHYESALDRVYLTHLVTKYHHNVTKAAKAMGVDKKTFTQHWRNAGLSPLRGRAEDE